MTTINVGTETPTAKPPVCLGPRRLSAPMPDDGQRGAERRVGHPQVEERGERTDRGGDDVVGDEQERADDGDDLRAVAHAGVHAAAVRVVLADDDVVERHQAR